jgi:hypothetical protein
MPLAVAVNMPEFRYGQGINVAAAAVGATANRILNFRRDFAGQCDQR